MSNPLFNIQYGLFVITTQNGDRDNGCISNTVAQVTAQPNRISVALNKGNFTTELIQHSGRFTASILSEAADFELFKHFGFQSGRTVDKFADFTDCRRVNNGTFAITRGTNAFISAEVEQTIDLGTHMLFIGLVTEMETLSDIPSATYNYYQANIKPKPQPVGQTVEGKTIWRCSICGYEYVGEELPDDFICPICKHPASDFVKVSAEAEASVANKYAGTKTEKNLEAAFAGESMARNKYTYYASVAKKNGYEQIAAQIMNGELAAGEQLPPIRTVAVNLRISVIPVKQAWEQLEREGFISTAVGRGSFVNELAHHEISSKRTTTAEELLSRDLATCREMGLSLEEIIDIVKKNW